jgi:hypothetical protein
LQEGEFAHCANGLFIDESLFVLAHPVAKQTIVPMANNVRINFMHLTLKFFFLIAQNSFVPIRAIRAKIFPR